MAIHLHSGSCATSSLARPGSSVVSWLSAWPNAGWFGCSFETQTGHAPLLDAWTRAGIEVVEGDLTQHDLGLSDSRVLDVDHVFHLGALYDLEADPETLERVNVGGTESLIRLLEAQQFRGTLHHVSSIAVAGDYKGTFKESMLDEKQTLHHAYHRTKHESERRVRTLRSFPFRIYRPGAVVGHSLTGETLRADGPYYLFKTIQKMRRNLPAWLPLIGPKGAPLQMVPVDFVAAAIDHLAHADGWDGKTFHVVDPKPPSFRRSFNLLAEVAGGPKLSRNFLRPLFSASPAGQIITQLGAFKAFRKWAYQDAEIPPVVADLLNPKVKYDASNMLAALEGSGIECPRQEEYVEVIYDYWRKHLDSHRDPEARRERALRDKVVIVTGASSGIGEALARRLGAYGAKVMLVARRDEELARVQKAIVDAGGIAEHVTADLASYQDCDRVIESTLDRFGRIDVLVNNAGRSIRRPLTESLDRFHDLERVMQINYFGPARLMRGVLPTMREHGGVIVNVLSAGANLPSPRFGAYTASKAALGQLGNTLAAEHAHENIHVSNIFLPWVRTPMMDATGHYEETEAMTPDDACDWILEGIVDRKRLVFNTETQRRFVLAIVAPAFMVRAGNVVDRIYADDPNAHPELEMDRGVFKRFIKGRMI